MQAGQLLAPRRQPLRLPGDLFRVHGVRLDTRAAVRLVVPAALQRHLRLADLGLEPLAGPGLAHDGPQRFQRRRLLVDLQRGTVAKRGERLRRHLAHGPIQACREPFDRLGMRLLPRQEVLGGPEVRQLQRLQLDGQVRLLLAQLLLQL